MHIESALKGIAVDVRCPNWKSGKNCGASEGPAKEACEGTAAKQEDGGCVLC